MQTKKRLAARVMPLHSIAGNIDTTDAFADTIYVNDDYNPILIHNELFTGHVVFRVEDFAGITPKTLDGCRKPLIPNTSYFDDRGRKVSLQVEGRFHTKMSGDDILFGAFFDEPIVVPRGSTIAIAMAKYIDPALMGDLAIEKPFMCSPILCGMTAMGVKNAPQMSEASADTAVFHAHTRKSSHRHSKSGSALANLSSLSLDNHPSTKKTVPMLLPEWGYGGARYLQENLLDEEGKENLKLRIGKPAKETEMNENNSIGQLLKETKKKAKNRRNHFLNESNRKSFTFSPDKVYGFEFSTTYADLNKFELKLGITIDVKKYLRGQPIRYEARTRDGRMLWRIELSMEDFEE